MTTANEWIYKRNALRKITKKKLFFVEECDFVYVLYEEKCLHFVCKIIYNLFGIVNVENIRKFCKEFEGYYDILV